MENLTYKIKGILKNYQNSFSSKEYTDENNDNDILMNIFNITPELKRENRQYWGRELGMCWELLINEIAKVSCHDYKTGLKIKSDRPNDLFIGKDAIDTKYRLGSGDSGTLKKFKEYGKLLKKEGFNPILLILRNDNLPAALMACKKGGWQIFTGYECLKYIKEKTNFDIEKFLLDLENDFYINRSK